MRAACSKKARTSRESEDGRGIKEKSGKGWKKILEEATGLIIAAITKTSMPETFFASLEKSNNDEWMKMRGTRKENKDGE